MTVVIAAAAIGHNVEAIIWSLIVLESVRVLGSVIGWRRLQRDASGTPRSCWREQLRYCLPIGLALVLVTFNKYLGNLFVAKALGAVALAHYTIGTQVQPIITVLRNSLSDALLPEMADSGREDNGDPLQMWRRTTVVSMILLAGAGVVLAKFAHPLVVTLFSMEYEPAVLIFQVYLLVLVREVFDFGVALRAINRTTPIIYSNLVAILINLGFLLVLLPMAGLTGAVVAFVASRYLEGLFIGYCTLHAYALPLRELAHWVDLAKVGLAAMAAAPALYGSFWVDRWGLTGVALGSGAYLLLFAAWLLLLRVPEARALLCRVLNARRLPARKPQR
jgi:O-antigen/teichoic acid export membrane protein